MKMTPCSSRSSRIWWYTTSDSYCAATPDTRRCFSASGMPSLSYVRLMSSGRSSQEVACFSVERTKYLMLSKSMPVRSEPHVGMGFLPNRLEGLEAQLEHPLGLVLERRDLAHHVLVEAALGRWRQRRRCRANRIRSCPATQWSRLGSWGRCQWMCSSSSFLQGWGERDGGRTHVRPLDECGQSLNVNVEN